MMVRPAVICLAPARNETWIIERFLACASLWADRIIIADQGSTDGTADTARGFPKVTVLDNPDDSLYNEHARMTLLIDEARKEPGPRILAQLDADEMLSSDVLNSDGWMQMLNSAPGTTVSLPWVNLKPDLSTYWRAPIDKGVFYHDDGRPYQGGLQHGDRLPRNPDRPSLALERGAVLHYQYTDWERMKSKHRWYECLEHLRDPKRSAVDLYRQYHHMDAVAAEQIRPVEPAWFAAYETAGIDMRTVKKEDVYWYDREVLDWFGKHGAAHFAKQAIWDVDWSAIAQKAGRPGVFNDPRNLFHKAAHCWLKATQKRTYHPVVKFGDRFLKKAGW
ncbi:MAG: glycosyltransferase family 2 protein [Candidatus Edwardsbacteria bacterium]|nr:glycosyltransferase family 2 protein [Candidatus Edwardsbacteria bacterium]